MDDYFVCPECGTVNAASAPYCVNCWVAFGDDTTLSVTTDATPPVDQADIDDLSPDHKSLYFYVAGAPRTDALIHRGRSVAILGRRSDDTPNDITLIDLNRFQGYRLGVSRQHARVTYENGRYFLEDLNSSNGTWLNGNRLQPYQPQALHRGDHVQLGELMMFVYYTQTSEISV